MKKVCLYDIKNSCEGHLRGDVIPYPDCSGSYWLCICKDDPTKKRHKTVIKCQKCEIWSHKQCMMLGNISNERLKNYEFKCLKCKPSMYILYYIYGFKSKKYFTKKDFKIEYVIYFWRRNKEYRINDKCEVTNKSSTKGIDLCESSDDNIQEEKIKNQNKTERKIEKRSEILSENKKVDNKVNNNNLNLNKDSIQNNKELKKKSKNK